MQLSRIDHEMLDGGHGPAKARAMAGLVQLGEAFDAADMVDIGYAHIHAGMALYWQDVELMEELAELGAEMAVPASANIANADTVNWRQTGAPENLVRLQTRAGQAHRQMGSDACFTCTPYWAGHWPTWNTHMASIESTVTIFCNSVLGARSNRDGFFAVYAAITGRYPRFGYHLDENRLGTHLVHVDAELTGVTDYSCLGFHVGGLVGGGVPVFSGIKGRPSLDALDALGATLATSGGVSLFILPGVTPPYENLDMAFANRKPQNEVSADAADVAAVYEAFTTGRSEDIDLVHLGCPHASFEEMKHYARLIADRRVHEGLELWVTTSRAVRNMAAEAGILQTLEAAGAKVVSDTCPMSCHFARTTSPDPALGITPPPIRAIVVDSAKQAKYVRDMVQCETLLTSAEGAIETAVSGRFVPSRGGNQ